MCESRLDEPSDEKGVEMARTEYEFADDGLARVYEEGRWFLMDRNNRQIGEKYDYFYPSETICPPHTRGQDHHLQIHTQF